MNAGRGAPPPAEDPTRAGLDLSGRLYLLVLSGLGAGLAAGILEIALIWPWPLTKHQRVPAYFLAYLAMPAAVYALLGIGAGLAGALGIGLLASASGRPWRRDACSRFAGLGFGAALALFLLQVCRAYGTGQKGAIVSFLGMPSALLLAAAVFGLFLLWNRSLRRGFDRGRRSRARRLIASVALVLAGSVLLLGDFTRESHEHGPPPRAFSGANWTDVLLVTIDTQRRDFIGCYGNAGIRTPVMDGLAAEGVLFESCVSQAPLTLPSHTSILTSTYPAVHGVRSNKGYAASPSLVTLPEVLRGAGYFTGAFVSAFVLDDRFGLDQGFGTYDGNFDRPHLYFISKFLDRSLFYRILLHFGFFEGSGLQRGAATTTRNALAWIETHRDVPFFAWVHYYDPHGPWDPVPPWDQLYKPRIDPEAPPEVHVSTLVDEKTLSRSYVEQTKANYMGEVSYTDHHIGRLRDALGRLGLTEKTLVIVTADHGESFGENGFWGHGGRVNDPSIRIPLIFCQPGRLPAGARVEGLCESIDIMPTVLDCLGIPGPGGMQGRTLLPAMKGSGGSRLAPRHAHAEAMGSDDPKMRIWSTMTDEWKYEIYPWGDREVLYRRPEGAKDAHDVLAGHPDVAAALRGELLETFGGITSGDSVHPSGGLDPETERALRALGYVQ